MPAFDRTGPRGEGPMTGWGLGPCGFGFRGFFMRRGRGLGRYFGGGASWTKEDLEDYKKALEEELEDVDEEINKFKK